MEAGFFPLLDNGFIARVQQGPLEGTGTEIED
jgi:hypothetical protein